MAKVGINVSDIIFWGEVNEEKSKSPTKWDHDILMNFTYANKFIPLDDHDDIISILLNEDRENIEKSFIYEGVDEYMVKGKKGFAEVSKGMEYTIVKLYGKDFDLEEITSRLTVSGVKNKKPHLEIKIPDIPKLLDGNILTGFRYKYSDEEKEKDSSLSKKKTIMSVSKGFLYTILFALVIGFIVYEAFITKYKDITPPTENFIAKKGNLIGYNVEGNLTLFSFANLVEELGIDEGLLFFIPETEEVTDRIIVEKAKDSLGSVLYEKGVRQVEFMSSVEGYDYARANQFRFDTYRNKTAGEADWSQYGYLGTGKAKKIVIRGRVVEREDGYFLSIGLGYAKLGDLADEGERFYDNLVDSESYITALFSLKSGRPVYVYGQIEKTFTSREGRNKTDKKLFVFRALYMRSRT